MSRFYNSTIERRTKICVKCQKPRFIFSHGLCQNCWKAERYKNSKPTGEKLMIFYDLEKWFDDRRKELTGKCQCGCGRPSQKNDDQYFKHSIAHIFPKAKFKSIKIHPLNFVERAFFGGCHSVMDDTSIERWPKMADWEDIKNKFHILVQYLTQEERATKFYSNLEKLIYGK